MKTKPREAIFITRLDYLKLVLREWAIAQNLSIPNIPEWTDERTENHPADLFDGIKFHLIRIGADPSAQIFLLPDHLDNSELWLFHELLKSVD